MECKLYLPFKIINFNIYFQHTTILYLILIVERFERNIQLYTRYILICTNGTYLFWHDTYIDFPVYNIKQKLESKYVIMD